MVEEIIKQGAEGRIYIGEYNGKECIIKERFVKKYRHPSLDEQITKSRIKAENKAMIWCTSADIRTPEVYKVSERKIYMEYLKNSITVKEYIQSYIPKMKQEDALKALDKLCDLIGSTISKMHKKSIIHGDLTTSNMLLDPKDENFDSYDLVMIDFGLSFSGKNSKDKGVDLYVLERALMSTHSDFPNLFMSILSIYREENEDVIVQFEKIRARGRKRTMIG